MGKRPLSPMLSPGENYACSAGFFFASEKEEGRELARNSGRSTIDHRCGVKW
jgi:hypothetical protein